MQYVYDAMRSYSIQSHSIQLYHVNGNGPVKSIVNKQYNSPVGIYSDEAIAETLSAQAEVLAEGVL
uniref:Zasp-like motif domain-containing protein n=1 Tax=Megaselia scalaris TaxID=36166 RepID=T1GJR2_MEGSC